jgi:hypothetical protein
MTLANALILDDDCNHAPYGVAAKFTTSLQQGLQP